MVQQVTFTLVDALQNHRKYYPKPYEWHQPVNSSLWWIIPTNQYTVYEHGKYFVDYENEQLKIGLHIEKGFDREAMQPQKFTLTDKWAWHSFLTSIKSGQVCNIIEEIQYIYGQTVHCRFDIKTSTGESRDYLYWYEGIMKDQNSSLCKTLEQLPSLFEQKEELLRCWIDCFIYIEHPFSEELIVEDLVDYVLKPLEQWVK